MERVKQESFNDDTISEFSGIVPKTEGIKYAGSKLKLLPHIVEMIGELKGVTRVLDGFSGSTRVSQALAQMGYAVTSNDVAVWSQVFATCYLLANKPAAYYGELIDELNAIPGTDGWYTEHYGGAESDNKRPFQIKNTRKLDAIRSHIEALNLPFDDKCVLLTSLIQAMDKVDNTLGHYAAYLSGWSARSYKDMVLHLPARYHFEQEHRVIRSDIFDTVAHNSFDLVYFDPPYGSNNEKMPPSRVRYNAYYHLWTTIIQHDMPELFGKANRRVDSRDDVAGSIFEEYRKSESGGFLAMEALYRLIAETDTRYLVLSYSSGGRATRQQLLEALNENGKVLKIKQVDYKKNVMSHMRSTNEWINSDGEHQEFLFLIEKK